MTYFNNLMAYCVSDLKTAALYYNSVFPYIFSYKLSLTPIETLTLQKYYIELGLKMPGYIDCSDIDISEYEILKSILPKELVVDGRIDSDYVSYCNSISKVLSCNNKKSKYEYNNRTREMLFYNKKLVDKCLIYTPIKFGEKNEEIDLKGKKQKHYMFTISKLDLIDINNIPWSHIVDFRNDEDSIKVLNNFLHMIHMNYNNMESEAIIEDLAKKKEEYLNVTKKWGFKLIKESILLQIPNSFVLINDLFTLSDKTRAFYLSLISTAWATSLNIVKEVKKRNHFMNDNLFGMARVIEKKLK